MSQGAIPIPEAPGTSLLAASVTDGYGQIARTNYSLSVTGLPPLTVFGTSGGVNQAASVAAVKAKRVRTYTPGNLSIALAAGLIVHHSRKVNQPALAASNAAEIKTTHDEFVTIHDTPGNRVTIDHERDNDQVDPTLNAADAAEYKKAWGVFAGIIAGINATRKYPLITCAVTTGVILATPGKVDLWYVSVADEIGFDIYDPIRFAPAAAFARSKGKPWSIPETGNIAGGTYQVGFNDPGKLARLKSDYALYMGFVNPPASVFQFNNNGSTIDGCPLSQAFWTTLCVQG